MADASTDDKSVMGQIANDQGSQLFDRAKAQFPYLADKNISVTYTPNQADQRMLEFYGPQEAGAPQQPRPTQLPLGQVGIQVFSPKVSPLDILGDYVSHYGVTADPRLKQMYEQFGASLDPNIMRQRYAWVQQHEGEQRAYDEWLRMSGLPAYFRGYTFNQWPAEFNQRAYTPEQIKILDAVRAYLGIK